MSATPRAADGNRILQSPSGLRGLEARAQELMDDGYYDPRAAMAVALCEATRPVAVYAVASTVEDGQPPVPTGDNSSLE